MIEDWRLTIVELRINKPAIKKIEIGRQMTEVRC